MKFPHGLREDEVLAVLDRIVSILAPSFAFGPYTVDDMKQEARIIGLEALPRYDPSRKLENFLYSHIRNRLINFKRDNYRRADPPCLVCHNAIGNRTDHPDGQFCRKYAAWRQRNHAKQSLSQPVDFNSSLKVDELPSHEETVSVNEMRRLIDEQLPVALRQTYLKMLAGVSVPRAKRQQVEDAVREILGHGQEA